VDFLKNIDVIAIVIQYAVLLFSLSIHEASHAWMADRFGDPSARYLGRVTLNPIPHIDPFGTVLFPLLMMIFGSLRVGSMRILLIGWAKPVPVNPLHLKNPRKDQIFISIAGPCANILAAAASFLLLLVIKHAFLGGPSAVEGSVLTPVVAILYGVMTINLTLAVFNILPIPPLDGHWVLYGLLPAGAAASLERFGSYGIIVIYALMYLGLLRFIGIPAYIAQRLLSIL
jgi:Zn-dependent protease